MLNDDPPRRRTTDWDTPEQPGTPPAKRNRHLVRGWLMLAAIAGTAIGLYLWGTARSHTPAHRMQSADATDGHVHDPADYDYRLSDLKPKCLGTAADLERYVNNTVAMLRNGGITDIDRLGLLVYLDQNTSLGQPKEACDQALALYAAERGGRP